MMRQWNRAQHWVEGVRLADQVSNDPRFADDQPRPALDRKLALAQFHVTAAALGDRADSGVSGAREVRRRQGQETP